MRNSMRALLGAWIVACSGMEPLLAADPTFTLAGRAGGPMHAVAVSGHYAIAGLEHQIVVFDATKPASPSLVFQGPTLENAPEAIATAGTIAAVADGAGGLLVYDLTDPAIPKRIATVAIDGGAHDVALDGDLAAVAAHDQGLLLYRLANPRRPAEVGSIVPAGRSVESVALAGTYAFLAVQPAGLFVVDLSKPATPKIVGRLALPGTPSGVAVEGSHAYVAAGRAGLQIVDVSDPASPQPAGASKENAERAVDVAVSGGRAFVADRTFFNEAGEFMRRGALRVVDVADPSHPSTLKSFGGDLVSVATDGALVFGASFAHRGGGGPTALVVADGAAATPSLLATTTLPRSIGSPMRAAGTSLYTVDEALRKFDVSHPLRPRLVWSLDLGVAGVGLNGIALGADYAYVGGGSGGLRVVRIAGAGAPELVKTVPGASYDVARDGSRLYVAGTTGVRMYSLANPASPAVLGSISSTWTASALQGAGARLYVAPYPGKALLIYDVSDPAYPQLIGSHDNGHTTSDLLVQDGVVALGDSTLGTLRFVDVTNAAAPAPLGEATLVPAALSGIARVDDAVYVSIPALPGGGLRRIDITDPAHPQTAGSFPMSDAFALGVAAFPSGVVAVGTSAGLAVLTQETP